MMNVLFLTIGEFDNLGGGSVHIDLVKKIAAMGHHVYVACKNERSDSADAEMEIVDDICLLHIKVGALKKNVGRIRKGISTITLEKKYVRAIKKHFSKVVFDLVLYHTPPITLEKVVRFVKKRDGAVCYLLLKDIFPQNAVDLGLLSKRGLNSVIYSYFRRKEKKLYQLSDFIGCMSPANVEYLLKNNSYLDPELVEVAPNSIELRKEVRESSVDKTAIRQKYKLPSDKDRKSVV